MQLPTSSNSSYTGCSSAALLAYAWPALLSLRFWQNDPTAATDGILMLLLAGYRLSASDKHCPDPAALCILSCSTLALLCVRPLIHLYSTKRKASHFVSLAANSQGAAAAISTSQPPPDAQTQAQAQAHTRLQPRLWPCRTTHTRFFPKKHSFAYSYLLVGVPVDPQGHSGTLISIDGPPQRRSWFHVDAEDHLERDAQGRVRQTLRAKLDDFLRANGADPSLYPLAYLVTAPRFLGYCFNPVSFWYLYSSDRALVAMILEVNNTFDERRMYLLCAAEDETAESEVDAATQLTRRKQTTAAKSFTSAWDKDFHVSPFNSRQGSYKLVAKDPRPFEADHNEPAGIISNDITLMSSQRRTKLLARVYSTQGPVADTSITVRNAARIALCWGWIGFLTFPRILKEAAKLYFRHTLELFYRPEVVAATSIARTATAQEQVLESFFARYLEDVVRRSADPLRVVYRRPVGLGNGSELIFESKDNASSAGGTSEGARQEVEVRVVTPAFYSRFVHYAHTAEAFDREFLCTDVRNQTMVASSTVGLTYLVKSSSSAAQQATAPKGWRWELVRKLRTACAAPGYGSTDGDQGQAANGGGKRASTAGSNDIRAQVFAGMDKFAVTQADGDEYRRIVTMMFMAARTGGDGGGGDMVLGSGDMAARVALSLMALGGICASSQGWGWWWQTVMVAAAHAWAGIKRQF